MGRPFSRSCTRNNFGSLALSAALGVTGPTSRNTKMAWNLDEFCEKRPCIPPRSLLEVATSPTYTHVAPGKTHRPGAMSQALCCRSSPWRLQRSASTWTCPCAVLGRTGRSACLKETSTLAVAKLQRMTAICTPAGQGLVPPPKPRVRHVRESFPCATARDGFAHVGVDPNDCSQNGGTHTIA